MKPAGWSIHVRDFQARFGSIPDGLLGPNTLKIYTALQRNRRAYVRFRGWHSRIAFMLQVRAVTEQA